MTAFACVLYRSDEISDHALSHGFAVALAGFAVFDPIVLVAEVRGMPGWSAAFYKSGLGVPAYEEFDHACDVFEDDLPPGLAIRDAAPGSGAVFAVVYSDEVVHDDAWRFGDASIERHFVREGEEGVEAGVETLDASHVVPVAIADEVGEAELENRLVEHRGTSWITKEVGVRVLGALMAALFEADRRVVVRLVDPSPASIAEETRRLDAALRRQAGRGASPMPSRCGGSTLPAQVAAFAETYDWNDPTDPSDLYREVAIGRLTGTLRFLRPSEIQALDGDERLREAPDGAYPVATLGSSALGGQRERALRIIALSRDGEALIVEDPAGRFTEAGPTLGELLRYLALGFKQRDEVEEDLIGALMLRAHLRCDQPRGERRS